MFGLLIFRCTKSPKGYFLDTGLICSLTGVNQHKKIDPNFRGQLYETRIFHNLLAIANTSDGQIYYLRKQGGLEREIDFILELEDDLLAIEVKSSSHVSLKDAENIERLKDLLPKQRLGLVIYNGTEIKKLRKNVLAIPDSYLF